jgi:glycosyltransferase involved in cell wall biosynthesis
MPRSAALDLLAHRRMLPAEVTLTLAAPVLPKDAPALTVEPMELLPGIEIVPLCYANTLRDGLKFLFSNRQAIARAVSGADFVHTSCGGFPFFLAPGFLAHRAALKKDIPRLFVMDCDLVGKLETDQIALSPNLVKRTTWKLYARLSWHLFKSCLETATVTFLLGRGVTSRYGSFAHNPLEIYQPIVGPEFIIGEAEFNAKCTDLEQGSTPRLSFVGRLAPEKGLEVMLTALAMLKDEGLPFEAHIYGDGPCLEQYRSMAESLALNDWIVFHGQVVWGKELFAALHKNHLQVVPHLTLEMTRNVFDGMAAGCGLIASDSEALKELMAESGAGVCFPLGQAAGLADELRSLLDRPTSLVSFMQKGLAFARANHRDIHIHRRLEFLKTTIPSLQDVPLFDLPDEDSG